MPIPMPRTVSRIQFINYSAVFLLAVGGSYLAASSLTFFGPVLQAPQQVDLGLRNEAQRLIVPLSIHNGGYKTLILSDFQVSCPSCLGFGEVVSGSFEYLKSARILPGESLQCQAHLTPVGDLEHPFKTAVRFKTNDPRQPEGSIEFIAQIQRHIVATPRELFFVDTRDKRLAPAQVEIRDLGTLASATVVRVECTDSSTFILTELQIGEFRDNKLGKGKLLARFSVKPIPSRIAEEAKATILVYGISSEKPILRIPVRYQSKMNFVITPSAIVFPRMVNERPDYSAEVECRSNSNHSFGLTLTKSSEALSIVVLPVQSETTSQRFRIAMKQGAASPPGTYKVGLELSDEGHVEKRDIPIIMRKSE